MENFPSLPVQIALLKLEEELDFLRNIVFRLPLDLPSEEIYKLFQKGILVLRLSSNILEFFEGLDEKDNTLVRNIVSSLFEALFITQSLFDYIGQKTPIFFEEITLFSEPIMDKLEQVTKTFHTVLNENELNIDFEEIAYILDEAAKTLDVALSVAKKLDSKIL